MHLLVQHRGGAKTIKGVEQGRTQDSIGSKIQKSFAPPQKKTHTQQN